MGHKVEVLKVSPNLGGAKFDIVSVGTNDFALVATNIFHIPGKRLSSELSRVFHYVRRLTTRCRPSVTTYRGIFIGIGPRSALLLNRTQNTTVYDTTITKLPIQRFAPARVGRTIANSKQTRGPRVRTVVIHVFDLPRGPRTSTTSTVTYTLATTRARTVATLAKTTGASVNGTHFASHNNTGSSHQT